MNDMNSLSALRAAVPLDLRIERIQEMQTAELSVLQAALGYGDRWGVIEAPAALVPPGRWQQPSVRTIDFHAELVRHSVPSSMLEAGILTLTQLALLQLTAPTHTRRGTIQLKPSSVIQQLRYWIDIVATVACKPGAPVGDLVWPYSLEDIRTSRNPKRISNNLARLRQYADRALWPLPPVTKQKDKTELSRQAPKPSPMPGKEEQSFQPLPDSFVADAGWRLSWIASELGPSLLAVAKGFVKIAKEHPLAGGALSTVTGRRMARRSEFLAQFQWTDSKGNRIEALPFEAHISGSGNDSQKFLWPPRTGSQVVELFKQLQMAHFFIFMLSAGSRVSESLSLKPGCISIAPDGLPLANGLTYKLSQVVDGEERDWPLPEKALEALRQQEALVAVLGELGSLTDDAVDFDIGDAESLWVRVGTRGQSFKGDENAALQKVINDLGLTGGLNGGSIHTHRFRKTLARLVALSLVGAPKILMDLFGHKTIEMTLHYILSDRAIRLEMEEVAKGQTILLAEKAIESAATNGGPAAEKLARAVERERARLGSEFGAANVRQLAETLTLSGRIFMLVRPGIICTKGPQESGPCNKKLGAPEPSRCRAHCGHRLEDAALRDDVDRLLAEAVKHYEDECQDRNEIQMEFWAGQVLTNLRRFEDLHQKWRVHPTVEAIVAGEVTSS